MAKSLAGSKNIFAKKLIIFQKEIDRLINRHVLPNFLKLKMFYVYVLRSKKDNQLYTGYTSDLKKRIKEHFSGKSFVTKFRLPLELLYYEAYKSDSDARLREKYLKTGWGRNYLKKTLKNSIL